jgi:hypothetical protein
MRPGLRAALLAALLGGLTACAGAAPEPSVADCATLVRYAGTTYVATGTVVEAGQSARWPDLTPTGELSACSDTGPDPRGASFPDDATPVTLVALPDVDEAVAVGYRRAGADDVVLLVAQDVAAADRDALLARFRPGPDEQPLVHAGLRALRGYLATWAADGPAAASRYLVPAQRTGTDAGLPRLERGRLLSYAVATRDPETGEPTLLVRLDLTFHGSPVAWSDGANARYVTLHRDGDQVLLELASGP